MDADPNIDPVTAPSPVSEPAIIYDVRRFGPAWTYLRDGVRILRLKGAPYDMGLQHGTLLAEDAKRGLYEYYARFANRRIVQSDVAEHVPAFLLDRLTGFLAKQVWPRLARKGRDTPFAQELSGLARGVGVDEDLLWDGAVSTDALLLLLSVSHLFGAPVSPASAACAACCTSIAAWDAATPDGRLVVGRNFDYFGWGLWEAKPVVALCEPESGQRYTVITSAGVGGAGVSAMNEAGLTFAMHTVPTRTPNPLGHPSIEATHEMARRAESIADAVRILGEREPITGWGYTITHGVRREAAVVEMAGSRHALYRPPGDTLAQSNHWRTDAMAPAFLDFSTAFLANSHARLKRAETLLAEHRGRIDPAAIVRFLGDSHDPFTGRERPLGNTIAHATNVASFVWRPESQEVWVGVGSAPVCRAEGYVHVNLAHEWEGPDARPATRLPVNPYSATPAARIFHRHYMDALTAWFEHHDADTATAALDAAIAADDAAAHTPHGNIDGPSNPTKAPTDTDVPPIGDPLYRMMRGLLHMRRARFDLALADFEAAGRTADSAHRQAMRLLWTARALDTLHRRHEALVAYTRALAFRADAGREIVRAAERGLSRPYRAVDARKVVPDLIFCDALG